MPDDLESLLSGGDDNDGMDDLESQLAALGILDDDNDDDPFSMLESMDKSEGTTAEPTTMGDGGLDLDAQLEALLSADQSADEDFEIRDISITPQNQSVYDPEVEDMGVFQYVKGTFKAEGEQTKRGFFEDISPWKMLATAGIGILFIFVGVASVIFVTLAIRSQEEAIAAVSHFEPIILPTDVANNANFVFLNQPMYLRGERFTLSRISAGYTGTFFFFDESFNVDDYIILLYNQAHHMYPLTTFATQASEGNGTVLQFGSLGRNTLFLTLHIQCRTSHEFMRFEYRFLSPPTHSAPLYLSRGVNAIALDDFSGLMIRHATFDNTSSQIHYSFTADPHAAGLRLNPRLEENEPLVTLGDFFSTINNLTNGMSAVYYEDFDITLGTANFGALLSLDAPMHVNFNDVAFFYPYPDFNVTPQHLFANDQSHPFSIQTGPYTLNLEAMEQQGTLVVLTLHGLDEGNRRRETIPNMTLRINANGRIFDIPGDTRSSERGSDVLFNLAPHLQHIRDVHISNYNLIIHSVEYILPQISIPLQMSPIYNNLPNARRFRAEAATTETFLSLLAYKSSDIAIDGIFGISDVLRHDSEFMGMFSPVYTQYRPMFGARVVTGDMVSNYDYLSVVEIQWVSGFGDSIEYFHAIFQVISRSQDGIWSIVDVQQI
ncbi:MAG: hypothetical protein FWE05_02865 [Defluviitaleaceae bacterium]|nr:hypothetical protein [Defluviitaleaceae bacterium]